MKVTPEEEGQLLRLAEAQNVTVPRLLVESTLAVDVGETATQRREAMANLFALYRLLGAISNNVNQMAKATNATGAVHVEMQATLAKVREVAEHIDAELDRLGESR
ncbi:plasmid mobilization relaxosome protein MobC [Pseudoclavibacter sp. JSM 162008]|uniref:plasmid mobilization relaxosome protein MobC n=1 Tax=Pseudoclavibacter sp. JSM 162008 TaxID=3229855 RepID=UPI003523E020